MYFAVIFLFLFRIVIKMKVNTSIWIVANRVHSMKKCVEKSESENEEEEEKKTYSNITTIFHRFFQRNLNIWSHWKARLWISCEKKMYI